MFVVSVSFCFKLERKETNAKVANLLGDYEKAAGIYASAAHKYWEAKEFEGALRCVINACENLRAADMPGDVIEGITVISKMFLDKRRPTEAMRLGDYYAQLEIKDPETFKGGAAFSAHIKKTCKEKKLLSPAF